MDHKSDNHHKKPSPSELLSSAKQVAEAAKATLHHGNTKIDKAKMAGAAADLLAAASHYGKLEGKSLGKYVGKAENYLHQYHTSHSTSSAANEHSSHGSGTGYGDYLKVAQGFLKKH
ncbi:nodulin-related protein 1-like [Carica papaya]|uniref:nodulin-related protein 1-like n=1 Tax=Carica papaya TaxID=3649 RepID=UPI000B8C9FF2|nr:nodulin-related protein 1-like [Carica papaya]